MAPEEGKIVETMIDAGRDQRFETYTVTLEDLGRPRRGTGNAPRGTSAIRFSHSTYYRYNPEEVIDPQAKKNKKTSARKLFGTAVDQVELYLKRIFVPFHVGFHSLEGYDADHEFPGGGTYRQNVAAGAY